MSATPRSGWGLCAKILLGVLTLIAIVWVAMLATLRFVIIPNIEGFRPRLTEFLQTSIGQKIEIGGLAAGWEGWNPRFVLHELKLIDKAGRVALRLPRVEQVVSWNSILHMRLTSRVLTIDGLRIVVRRDANNRISIAGLDLDDSKSEESDPRIADWFLAQGSVSLRKAEVVWHDNLRGAPPIALKDLNARLVNSGNRHRLGINASWSDTVASPIQILVDVNGDSSAKLDQWTGQTYVRMDAADFSRVNRWINLPFPVSKGVGGFQTWVSIHAGRPNEVIADVKLRDVLAQFDSAKAPLTLRALTGRMRWSEARGKGTLTSLKGENLTAEFPDKQILGPFSFDGLLRQRADQSFERNEFNFDGIELAMLGRLADELPLPQEFQAFVGDLQPRGKIGKTRLEWTGNPKSPTAFNVSTSFTDLGIKKLAGLNSLGAISGTLQMTEQGGQVETRGTDVEIEAPGFSVNQSRIEKLNAQVRWTQSKDGTLNGQIDFNGGGLAIDAPRIFSARTRFDRLATQARWIANSQGLKLDFSQTEVENADAKATFSGTWSREKNAHLAGVADLVGVIHRGQADRIWAYLPSAIDGSVRNYVKGAVTAGKITRGDFLLKGPLEKFPFASNEFGQWRIAARIDDVSFDYADQWPKIVDADINFEFAGTRLSADTTNGKIADVPIKNLRVSIADTMLNAPQLSIVGNAAGQTSQFLKFIDASPVAAWIDGFHQTAVAAGDGELAVAIEIPLGETNAKPAVRGDYEFKGNTVKINRDIPELADVRGKLAFTEKSVSIRDMQTTVFGGPAKFNLRDVPGGVLVTASGVAELATLKSFYEIPHLERLGGRSDWALELDSTKRGNFTLTSSLTDAVVSAPAPLGKVAGESRPLVLRREVLGEGRDLYAIDFGSDLKWRMRLASRDGARKIESSALGYGAPPPELPAAQSTVIAIAQPKVNVDQLRDVVNQLQVTSPIASGSEKSGGSPPTDTSAMSPVTEVKIDTPLLVSEGYQFSNVALAARPRGEGWALNFRSAEADGIATWRSDAQSAAGLITARLTKLIVSPREPASDGRRAPPPAPTPASQSAVAGGNPNWPVIDIAANSFTLRGNALGTLELTAAPVGANWRIDKLIVSNEDAVLKADGVWRKASSAPQTSMNANLEIFDAAKFFARIGLGEGVKESKGKLNGSLQWPGSPAEFDLRILNGEFKMELTAGRFTKADPGIAKLLGIISLQSLGRRLLFDYRDLFTDGFSFDAATASLKIQNGLVTTDDFDIYGPTARVEIRGKANLVEENQDLAVRILPDFSTSIAVGAGIATANPLVGAGVFIASKVFKNPIDKGLSTKMRVTGTWADPKVESGDRPAAAANTSQNSWDRPAQ